MRRLCVLLGVLVPLSWGACASARADEGAQGPTRATPARYEAGQAGAPTPATRTAAPTNGAAAPAARDASAPGAPTSRGKRIARGASVSVVFVLLAFVTLFLI
jgi:hypothetical protein